MRLYDKQEWKRVRRAVLANNPLCVTCTQAGIIRLATDVDHIVPIANGGAWYEPDNLQPLCAACHTAKTRADEGKTAQPYIPGCDPSGRPIDQRHPWNS